jgi:hypothetical protein
MLLISYVHNKTNVSETGSASFIRKNTVTFSGLKTCKPTIVTYVLVIFPSLSWKLTEWYLKLDYTSFREHKYVLANESIIWCYKFWAANKVIK